MNRVSILEQTYLNQRKSIVEQQVKTHKCWHGTYRFYFIWMFIGILTGGIPLTVFVSMYIKQSQITTTSTKILSPMLRWNPVGITVAGVTGVSGIASNNLNIPYQAVLDCFNTLYIADRNNNRTQKFLMGASYGSTVAGQVNGSSGTASSQLRTVVGVAVNSNSDIFIVDSSNSRIQFWANSALTGTTVAGNPSGIAGNSSNFLYNPCGIALDSNTGTIYIADNMNHRVMSYASGASSGTLVAGGNGKGISPSQLSLPFGIYFDSFSNSLTIANSDKNTVVRWVLGASNWTLLAGNINGITGNTSTFLSGPRGVTLDPMGNLYVADALNHRIQLFMSGQTDGITIMGTAGVMGSNATLFNRPYSVAFDGQLNIYVADAYNYRIQKFVRY